MHGCFYRPYIKSILYFIRKNHIITDKLGNTKYIFLKAHSRFNKLISCEILFTDTYTIVEKEQRMINVKIRDAARGVAGYGCSV